jgi:hypothetical protein
MYEIKVESKNFKPVGKKKNRNRLSIMKWCL